MPKAMLRLVLIGVSGCGKSTVGAAIAPLLSAVYLDGDTLHPAENIAKMRRGLALGDADRRPWLVAAGQALAAKPRIILGCSALKRRYRDLIRDTADCPVGFIHLSGAPALVANRLHARHGHFMPPALLASQFADLEPPTPDEAAITVSIDQPLDALLADILRQLPETGML